MSACSTRGQGTRGHGRGRRGAQAGSFSSKNLPNLYTSKTPVPPASETRSRDRAAGGDTLSQAMLQILDRVVGSNTGSRGRGSIKERFRSNGAELFRGVAGVAPNMAEYWIEATDKIIDDLDFTAEQKQKGAIFYFAMKHTSVDSKGGHSARLTVMRSF